MLPTRSVADTIFGSLNGILWATHWSYTSGPWSRRSTSSIQSVAGQPVATPDSMPAHHGLVPLAAILSLRAISSFQVVGMVYPFSLNIFGEYHTKLLTLEPNGAP